MYSIEIKLPFIMTCNVTGLKTVFTSKEFIARKIKSYGGDIKKMLDTYVREDAKRLLREGKPVEEVIHQLGGIRNPKEVDLNALVLDRRMSSDNYRKAALHRNKSHHLVAA